MIDPKKVIQFAWVFQAVIILVFSIIVTCWFPPDRAAIWIQLVPILVGITAAEGTAGSVGPLVSKKITNGTAVTGKGEP